MSEVDKYTFIRIIEEKGLASRLIDEITLELKNKGIYEFVLDSDILKPQKIWQKKFGEPQFIMKDYGVGIFII